jgi:hypothetical protein
VPLGVNFHCVQGDVPLAGWMHVTVAKSVSAPIADGLDLRNQVRCVGIDPQAIALLDGLGVCVATEPAQQFCVSAVDAERGRCRPRHRREAAREVRGLGAAGETLTGTL